MLNKPNAIFYWIIINTIAPITGWSLCIYLNQYLNLLGLSILNTYKLVFIVILIVNSAQGWIIGKWHDSNQWILIGILSWTIALPITYMISMLLVAMLTSYSLGYISFVLKYTLAGIITGTLAGFFQWLMLRRRYYRANLWLIASVIAYTISYFIIAVCIIVPLNNNSYEGIFIPIILLTICGAIAGCITGLSLVKIVERPKFNNLH
ncbi:hypothetical protein IQ255_01700 [Pleurocapsales cyanobacterium LEGE 10410]|nr:hypothetical protein [Pleurocapsales cyanobacterium LEGE 10410]